MCAIYMNVHTLIHPALKAVRQYLVFQVLPPSLSGPKGQVCSRPCVGMEQSSPGGEG